MTPDGTVYVNTWSGVYYGNDKPHDGGFLIALKDTKGTGHADVNVRFGPTFAEGAHGGTGIWLYKNWLYAELNDKIVRYALKDGEAAPTGKAETILSGMPITGDHPMHGFAIDADGNLFVEMGTATNACEKENRMPHSPGIDPCTELETRGGIWRYDANKTDQVFSPKERYATGIRNGEGFDFDSAGRLYVTQHGRDQLHEDWPELYTAAARLRASLGGGGDPQAGRQLWLALLLLRPRAEEARARARNMAATAARRSAVATSSIHRSRRSRRTGRRTISRSTRRRNSPRPIKAAPSSPSTAHGTARLHRKADTTWCSSRSTDGKTSGDYIVFADGFAGPKKEPGGALHRPSGLAVGPDGALYITDDKAGRIWRVTYNGDPNAPIEAAPAPSNQAEASPSALPPEGVHPDAGLPVPPGATAEQVALGKKIFHGEVAGATCAGCHGADGIGTPVGADLQSGTWLWGDGSLQSITETIKNGVPKPKDHPGAMPPYGGVELSDADLAAVAAYVWAIGHRQPPASTTTESAQ